MDMRSLREQSGLRAEIVAVELDMSISTIRNWEAGRTIPTMSIYQVAKLLKLYNCSFETLKEAVSQSRQQSGFTD